MTSKQRSRLTKSYKKYRMSKKNKQSVLGFLRAYMPEIIYRTSRLEGERVTRKMVSLLFK